ncbi:MAG: molybdopterin-dependent oxidoreductase [Clostridia bacterium]
MTVALVAGLLCAVGCAQQGLSGKDSPSSETQYKDSIEESEAYLADENERWREISKEYAPEIRTLKDGTKVQRTPTEYQCYHWNRPYEGGTAYNNYYLDADNRGCGACHEDLADTLSNMEYSHPTVWNESLGSKLTVDQCMLCHSADDDYEMGTIMHGVHNGERNNENFEKRGGKCISCHNMTENKNGAELWDLVKYDHLDGIIKVPDVKGDFSFDQTTTVAPEDMFTYDWIHSKFDSLIHIMGKNVLNEELPKAFIDNFEITMGGLVNKPYTAKLSELIAEAEADGATVTKLSKIHCVDNMPGGGGISNVEITGIPLSWLVEKGGGASKDVTGVLFDRREFHTNGAQTHSNRGVPQDSFKDVYLVYEIGGKALDPSQGSPCINWVEGCDAQSFVKQCVGYILTDEEKPWAKWMMNGFNSYGEGEYINKPNATILKVPEGKIIETGKPFTFEGYADAYDESVTKLEFSMDKGKTWTAYDLGQTDAKQWVYWHYTWTPETDGSYVLMVRATTDKGLVGTNIPKIMVNAKSNQEG